MPLSRSARLIYYRCTLVMAWVAMCLLFAGPLISQLQASQHAHDHQVLGHQVHNHQDHQAHHHGHMAGAEHHEHSVDGQAEHPVIHQTGTSASPPDTVTGVAPSRALSDWHNQCGYCELWQHTPSLSIALPTIASEALVVLGSSFLAPQIGGLFQYNYPHSLTRGPPAFMVIHLKNHAQAMIIVTRKSKKETGLLGFFKA